MTFSAGNAMAALIVYLIFSFVANIIGGIAIICVIAGG